MGTDPTELKLDLNSPFVPTTISDFLDQLSAIDDCSEKLSKLTDYLHAHEEELRKINAFKSELPLCILLLNDVISRLKQEITQCRGKKVDKAMDEFIPLKGNSDEGEEDSSDLVSSARLWSINIQYEDSEIKNQEFVLSKRSKDKEEQDPETDLNLSGGSCRSNDGLFLAANRKWESEISQRERKLRRCWSPDLHRRFLNVLHDLGGPERAKPKLIKERMFVDDLTIDEIKSHLQKYRLHIRKLPGSPAMSSSALSPAKEHSGDSQICRSESPQGTFHMGGLSKAMSVIDGAGAGDSTKERSGSESV